MSGVRQSLVSSACSIVAKCQATCSVSHTYLASCKLTVPDLQIKASLLSAVSRWSPKLHIAKVKGEDFAIEPDRFIFPLLDG